MRCHADAVVLSLNRFSRQFASVCLALSVVALSGCSTLEGWMGPWQSKPAESEAVVPLLERVPLEPISRNTFFLESVHQSVVGEPQIVLTREEDTFSDLAREYGLGYDELVAANPEIDPWLPGEGFRNHDNFFHRGIANWI